jgi:Uma2 family endonuclease
MTITINLKSIIESIDDRLFEQLCIDNPNLRLELTSKSKLVILPHSGGNNGIKIADLLWQVASWNSERQVGTVFSSNTGFKLSNGAIRSPNVTRVSARKMKL